MFDNGGSGPVLEADAARALLRACGNDSAFAQRLSDPAAVFLILDAAGERILHASEAAMALRRAVARPDGRLAPSLRIGEQAARARAASETPPLLRVHLDPRRIAPPALMTLLRAVGEDGRTFLILLALAPLPRLRTRPDPSPDASGPVPVAATIAESRATADDPVPPLAVNQRFTWRSDAHGTLIELSRPAGDPLRERMLGRTWERLAASGALRDAEGLIAALARARTFRSIPVTVMAVDGTVIDIDVSGAPVDRAGRDVRGFGQIRAIVPPTQSPPACDEAPASPDGIPPAPPSRTQADDAMPLPLADPSLSSHEHAAFREIARALGARFAGDEADAPAPERGAPCAVMPFPTPAIRAAEPGDDAPDPDGATVAVLERLPVGVLVYRRNTVLFANRRLLDLTGYADVRALETAGGIEGLFRGLAPHARDAGDTPIVLAARDGGCVGILVEHTVLDWAGQPADLLLARDAEASEAARADRAHAVAQDFAGRRGSDALEVIEALEDGIATLDGQGRVLTLNRSAAAAFGLDPREVVGASFLGLFAPENAVALLAQLHAEAGATPAAPAQVTARGTGTVLRVRVLPLGEDSRNRLCAVIRDVSARAAREPEEPEGRRGAQAAGRHAADVLTRIDEEVRGPIDGILAYADLMLAEPFGPLGSERYREHLRDIHASGTHVLDLVKDLLDLARIEAGRLDLNRTEIPLNDVVARCVALLQPQASRERIVLRTSFSSDLAVLVADERSVRQAALNVIANAIAYTEAGGQVIVSTSMADRGEIALRVRDTGTGMTADEVEVALQPFHREGPVGQRKGTGLGLPLTKALVEANRGRFRVDSRKHEGTLVEMLFPADAASKRA